MWGSSWGLNFQPRVWFNVQQPQVFPQPSRDPRHTWPSAYAACQAESWLRHRGHRAPTTRSCCPRATSRPAGTTSCTTCPPRPRRPASRAPASRSGPDDLTPLFPMDLILQEVSGDQYVEIPGEVLDVYALWRPSPLFRAHRLEKALGTPARIYYKYEGVSPAGSHKPNTAVPQAFYNAKAGIKKLTTETGAGQWGTALAFACAQYDLECEVWQVRRVVRPEAVPPDDDRDLRRHGPPEPQRPRRTPGAPSSSRTPTPPAASGIAICEAVEVAAQDPTTNYALGSVLNHVLLHQTVIGEEALLQLRHGRGDPGPARRLHRRRLELRRSRLPVPPGEVGRGDVADDPRRRAGVLPVADPGHLRLRLRRHPRDDPADEDAHARPRLRAGPDPRRWPALPRHEPADLPPLRDRRARGGRQDAVGVLRGRRALRPHRGDRAGARADARAGRGGRGGTRPARSPARRR